MGDLEEEREGRVNERETKRMYKEKEKNTKAGKKKYRKRVERMGLDERKKKE